MPTDLRSTAIALDDDHQGRGWGVVPTLYGVRADGTWTCVDEGDPYEIVDRFALLPDEQYEAVALVCEGWAAPLGGGRASRHPARVRVRVVAVAGRDGTRWSVLHRHGHEPDVLADGDGALMARLRRVWEVPPAA